MAVVLLVLEGGLALGAWVHVQAVLRGDVEARVERVLNLQRVHAEEDFARMNGELLAVAQNDALLQALERRDRETLLDLATPIFHRLRNSARVTHFYFHDRDRVNVLRVHEPAASGDRIDRYTARRAAETGEPVEGVELGPLGTLTLRVVRPCSREGEVVGFVELGHEMEYMLDIIQRSLEVELCVLVRKDLLEREGWETGRRMLGREPDWNRYRSVVVTGNVSDGVRADLDRVLAASGDAPPTGVYPCRGAAGNGRFVFRPLLDAEQRDVGRLVLVLDLADRVASAVRLVLGVALVGAAAGAALLLGLFVHLGRIERDDRPAA
ncbi:MAG: cache domain-containing protein [Planctomycetota bacterium]